MNEIIRVERLSKTGILKRMAGLLLCIATTYNSGYAMSTATNGEASYYFLVIPASLMLTVIILRTLRYQTFKVSRLDVVYVLFCWMSVVPVVAGYGISWGLLLYVSYAYCMVRLIKFDVFVEWFTGSMQVIAVISILGYAVVTLIGLMPPTLPLFVNHHSVSYHNWAVYFAYTHNLDRNMGIFWEPGLYATFLVLAMVFEICFRRTGLQKRRLIILVVALLSTLSTAGYALIPLVILLLLERTMNLGTRLKATLTLFLITSSMVLLMFYDSIIRLLMQYNPVLFGKLLGDSLSSSLRVREFIVTLEVFAGSPAFGVGFYNVTSTLTAIIGNPSLVFQSATMPYFLAAFGVFGLVYVGTWICGISNVRGLGFVGKTALFLILFGILNKEPHMHNIATYCIMFYLIQEPVISPDGSEEVVPT